jgi:hypothetical protein
LVRGGFVVACLGFAFGGLGFAFALVWRANGGEPLLAAVSSLVSADSADFQSAFRVLAA